MLFGKKTGGVEWLVVCLGNPGDKYENTRHNVGFMVADELAERKNIPVQRLKFKALTNTTQLGGAQVLLMKPVTYMNLSGEAVRQAADFYKVSPDHVLVVSDDVSLPVGRLRIRKSGSAGGHNGLKNIIQQLGTDQFPRLKVGVGEKPHPDYGRLGAGQVRGRGQEGHRRRHQAGRRRGGVLYPGRPRQGHEPFQLILDPVIS